MIFRQGYSHHNWFSCLLIMVGLMSGNVAQCAVPQRIVSLAPHITELLYAIGAGQRIVATVSFSDYPPAARKIPRVGDAFRIDIEKLVSLHPDIVIAWEGGGQSAAITRLRQLDFQVLVITTNDLQSIAVAMVRLGELLDIRQPSRRAAEQFRHRLAALRTRYEGRPPVRVFYQVWEQPLMTVNRNQIISDVMEVCGGRNIFGALDIPASSVSLEAVLAENPQAILAPVVSGQQDSPLAFWKKWKHIDAVRYDNLFPIAADEISRHSARILDGLESICLALDRARSHLGIEVNSNAIE